MFCLLLNRKRGKEGSDLHHGVSTTSNSMIWPKVPSMISAITEWRFLKRPQHHLLKLKLDLTARKRRMLSERDIHQCIT